MVEFIHAAASQDPSLANLSLVDVKKGSRVAVLKAQPHSGIPGLFTANHAIAQIFDPKQPGRKSSVELPAGILNAFRAWTKNGVKIEIAYYSKNSGRPRKMTFDQKSLTGSKAKPTKPQVESTHIGRLVRLHSDENLFGLETAQGVLHCPFPENERESWIALYERIVSVRVKAPQRHASRTWRASETLSIQVLPDPPGLDFGDAIPGLAPAKLTRTGGFSLDDLFPGMEPGDADSLADFLKQYREH